MPEAAAGDATARPRPVDPHSGLPVEAQFEVLRRTRAAGVDSMPMPNWGGHRDHGVLEAVAEKLRHGWALLLSSPLGDCQNQVILAAVWSMPALIGSAISSARFQTAVLFSLRFELLKLF